MDQELQAEALSLVYCSENGCWGSWHYAGSPECVCVCVRVPRVLIREASLHEDSEIVTSMLSALTPDRKDMV